VKIDRDQKPIIMNDEYSPKDLLYQNKFSFDKKEITGPSLKDMEYNKRFKQKTNFLNQKVRD